MLFVQRPQEYIRKPEDFSSHTSSTHILKVENTYWYHFTVSVASDTEVKRKMLTQVCRNLSNFSSSSLPI